MIKIKRGLNLPLAGEPRQLISSGPFIRTVAVVAEDYVGMKPTMLVKEGDHVLKGQPLFEDKKTPGVFFTSPAAGTILNIHRGDQRAFRSVTINITGDEQVQFKNYHKKDPAHFSAAEVRSLLIESGCWTSLRTRPFSKTPAVDAVPHSIFVNVMDTQPLAPNPEVVLDGKIDYFNAGVLVLSKLAPKVFVVTGENSLVNVKAIPGVTQESFSGPHPSGNVGTHIHFLDPVSINKFVWHLDYQDVIAIGHLFRTGNYSARKVVALSGPEAKNPRLVETIRGANITELTNDEFNLGKEVRLISGSVLAGRTASGPVAYLGAFHNQVTILKEGHHREFLGWQSPGINKFSLKRIVLGSLLPGKRFAMDTNSNGSLRSIVPIGSFEAVMPMDILPTNLLRYLMAGHTDYAASLGALELDEEDLALCTFVDPCKNDYGPVLREVLNVIEKEG
ncbi:MAG: Na(+)-translocating NADH-quinone reductase subunit A [Bdellovibrionales bacterium]|nr:Na(+)-translocating NADH-quinone reductase subunit A [Bdellovibrionales bacterium]